MYKVPKSRKDKLVYITKMFFTISWGVLLAVILIVLPSYLVFFLWNEVLVPLTNSAFHVMQFYQALMIYLGGLMICVLISKKQYSFFTLYYFYRGLMDRNCQRLFSSFLERKLMLYMLMLRMILFVVAIVLCAVAIFFALFFLTAISSFDVILIALTSVLILLLLSHQEEHGRI